MTSSRFTDFDVRALHAALDAQRQSRWQNIREGTIDVE
jgi:hypothetical protein